MESTVNDTVNELEVYIRGRGSFNNLVRDLENATNKNTAEVAIKALKGSWVESPINSARYAADRLPDYAERIGALADRAERLIMEKSSEFNIGFSKTQIALYSALGLSVLGTAIFCSGVFNTICSGVFNTNTLDSSAGKAYSSVSNLCSSNSSVVNNATTQAGYGYAANATQAGYGYAANATQAGYGYAANATQAGYGYAAKAINLASQLFNSDNLKIAGSAVGAGIIGLVSLKAFT